MPFYNLNSKHYAADEKQAILDDLAALQNKLAAKMANLTSEENQRYGSISEQNKLIVNKAKDFYLASPELASDDVDWEEFLKDVDSRNFEQQLLTLIDGIRTGLFSAKVLHDYDAYNAALVDKRHSDVKAENSADARYKSKSEEYKQFFTGGRPPATDSDSETA